MLRVFQRNSKYVEGPVFSLQTEKTEVRMAIQVAGDDEGGEIMMKS